MSTLAEALTTRISRAVAPFMGMANELERRSRIVSAVRKTLCEWEKETGGNADVRLNDNEVERILDAIETGAEAGLKLDILIQPSKSADSIQLGVGIEHRVWGSKELRVK